MMAAEEPLRFREPRVPESVARRPSNYIALGRRSQSLPEPSASPKPAFWDVSENPHDKGTRQPARIQKSWSGSSRSPLGLENRGVTCYMNAALQALFHIPAIAKYLTDVYRNKVAGLKYNSVTRDVAALYKKVTEPGHRVRVHPSKLIRRLDDINPMLSEWRQEDAHEFWMSIVSRLQEDSVPKGEKLRSSIIHDIFGGTAEQRITCKKCGHVSTTNQDFYDLSVSFSPKQQGSKHYSLDQAIEDFFTPEAIRPSSSHGKGYKCESCHSETSALKGVSIKDAPEYLTVHIKRFKFEGEHPSKVKDPMSYPVDLDLTQYNLDGPLKYKLVAVIIHEGRTVSSGHYVALCRQPGGEWVFYDDDELRRVSESFVRKQPSSYMLIYSRLLQKPSNRTSPAPQPENEHNGKEEQGERVEKTPKISKRDLGWKHRRRSSQTSHGSRRKRTAEDLDLAIDKIFNKNKKRRE